MADLTCVHCGDRIVRQDFLGREAYTHQPAGASFQDGQHHYCHITAATPPVAERIDPDSDWTAEQWGEWSNELASHLPPHVEGDEAQVEIVTAWVQRVALPHTLLHDGDAEAITAARQEQIERWAAEAAEYAEQNLTTPVPATEAVSGYTSHGHRIAWVVQTGRPASVARCGGPGLCTVCSLEAGMATNERHGR